MKKFFLWLIALAGGLLILLVGAVLLLPQFVNVESYIPKIEEKVAEATGRPFKLGSDFDVSVFPWAGVSFSNLQMGNPQQFGGGEFIKVDSFEARVKIMPLLSKKIEIDKFVLDGPEIRLVKLADGQGNWSLGDGEKPVQKEKKEDTEVVVTEESKGEGFALASLEVDEFSITNGRIIYADQGTNQTKEVNDITFKLLDVSLERPVSLLFQAKVDGKPMAVEGSLGPIGTVPGKGTVKIDLLITAMEQLSVALKGEVVEPSTQQKFAMNLAVAPFSPRQLVKGLNIPFPVKTSDPQALSKVGLQLNVSGDPETISVKNSAVELDDSKLQFSANVKDMSRPDVTFNIALDKINLDRYMPPPSDKKEKEATRPAGTPSADTDAPPSAGTASAAEPAKINYEPLRRLILHGEISAGEIVAHGAKVENVNIKILGKDGIFDVDPLKLDLYQGNIGIVGNFNVQGEKPVGKVDVKAETIQVGPLLRDAVQKDVLEGSMNAVAAISFTGDNGPDIKKTLNGNGDLKFLDGALVGIDIAEMGRSLTSGLDYQKPAEKPRTDFAELLVPFSLENGLFATQDTSLSSPLLRLNANGTADLVSEKLNMKVQPKIVGTLKGQGDTEERTGLKVPILVEGTFAKPEFSADLSAMVSAETIEEVINDPEAAKEQLKSLEESGKSLEETGKSILKGFGFGN